MNNLQHQETVKRAVKKKFRGKESISAKGKPLFPETAEREFVRLTNGYMRMLNQTMKDHLPVIMAAYKDERRRSDGARYDEFQDIYLILKRELQAAAEELEQKVAAFELEHRITKIANTVKNTSLREWKKSVRKAVGVDLMSDYYKGSFYTSEIAKWVSANVLKIQSIPMDTLGSMREIILDGFRSGKTITDITRDVQDVYDISKSHAKFIARDQISTLNAEITKRQQTDAGVTRYKWSTSRDGRVRDCHAELEGQIFSWDDPPEMWYDTKQYGTIYTGRFCNPGEDYACRCCAIPVFDWQTIDLPIKEEDTSDEG